MFWVEIRRLQDQSKLIRTLVFHYCISNTPQHTKHFVTNVMFFSRFFQTVFSNKIYLFHLQKNTLIAKTCKSKYVYSLCFTFYVFFVFSCFSFSFFNVFLVSFAMLSTFIIFPAACTFLWEFFFFLFKERTLQYSQFHR